MTNNFSLISTSNRSLHVQVARSIARRILSGELPQGSIVPNEMALCEQFGVSRTALREAMKLLTSKGLLESRPKIGTKVVNRAYWNFLDPQLIEWMDGLSDAETFCSQFLGLRRAVEPEACALAAVNATAKQRIELSEIFQKMVKISNQFNHEEWIEVDLSFHRLIFNATNNDFYLPFGNILTTMFRTFILHSSKDGGVCLNEHRMIYEAIMAGDSELAREVSLDHLQKGKHRLAETAAS
ncbi:FadR/GntR family transcriptional regulator [Marinomonas sp. 15G1-11]|uniref:FadR/GntR family transcriptional regulator n=1 Tax=Marinomonas phaeophyticola TaxID=3004091 RepID=A0ABT4JP79_9GAMM|nr:FadR/GntR family transcriptional regulator [Marinomonas sp. 15G1-11]MCZ2720159.1 FadR/GntR family transcriptional regulator [Marinomonas sp. 15G1-11]